MTFRGTAVGAVLLLLATSHARAGGSDKAACAAAAEVGQRMVKAHKLVSAREQLLLCSNRECPDVISQDCTQWLGEVERSMASVIIKPRDARGQPIADVRVTEGGVVVIDRTTDSAFEIDPGAHALRLERTGYEPTDKKVEIVEGRRNQEVVVTMQPAAIVQPPPVTTPSTPVSGLLVGAITATGLGLIGGGMFAGFAASATSDENVLKPSCAPNCTPAQTSSISTKFTVANVSLVTGIVALAAAGVLWVLWGTSHKAPSLPTQAFSTLTWRF